MDLKQAEDLIYKSYLKAEKYQDYNKKDSDKRRPDLTKEWIKGKCQTPAVVITGSKGKGSVANMVSQILQTRLSVGLMTSPHLSYFCERFRVNGKPMSKECFIKGMEVLAPEIEALDETLPNDVCISPMGIQALLALDYFNSNGTDFNVFECGKGAKNDDVNNISHKYAIVNTIFLEHTRELGSTLAEIAADKAHVITGEQNCVYIGKQTEEALRALESRANKFNTPLKIYGRDFWEENITYTNQGMKFDVVIGEERITDICIPLLGAHQARNCALAMALCKDVFEELGLNKIKEKSASQSKLVDDSYTNIKKNLVALVWPGRMQILSSNPFIMLDACINKASCENVLEVIKELGLKEITAVVGIPDDKDFAGVVRAIKPVSTHILLTKSNNPHYVFTKHQQEILAKESIEAIWTDSITGAIATAKSYKKPIVILGTTSVVSEVSQFFSTNK